MTTVRFSKKHCYTKAGALKRIKMSCAEQAELKEPLQTDLCVHLYF